MIGAPGGRSDNSNSSSPSDGVQWCTALSSISVRLGGFLLFSFSLWGEITLRECLLAFSCSGEGDGVNHVKCAVFYTFLCSHT